MLKGFSELITYCGQTQKCRCCCCSLLSIIFIPKRIKVSMS